MPIYEYEAFEPEKGCSLCRQSFETLRGLHDSPLDACPECGQGVRKIVSRFRAAVIDYSVEHAAVEDRITGYEREGRWSHAAELADSHSSRINDAGLKERALDNYAKAGYNSGSVDSGSGGENQ